MQLAAGQAQDNPPDSQRVRMKDACFLIYTSGTTGLPKASIMSHGKWIKAYGGFGHSGLTLNERDVLYLTLPCYHNNAVTVCWSAVLAGARPSPCAASSLPAPSGATWRATRPLASATSANCAAICSTSPYIQQNETTACAA